jgi:hypothetical protein
MIGSWPALRGGPEYNFKRFQLNFSVVQALFTVYLLHELKIPGVMSLLSSINLVHQHVVLQMEEPMIHKLRKVPMLHIRQGRELKIPNIKS